MRTNILESIYKFSARQVEAFDLLAGELGAQKIDLVQAPKQTERSFEVGQKLFLDKILPFLTPHEAFTPGKIHGLANPYSR